MPGKDTRANAKQQGYWFSVAHAVIDDGHMADMGPVAFAVLCVLLRHADTDGVSFPSKERISREAGVNRRTVDRSVNRLIALGMIAKEKRPTKDGNNSNLYKVKHDILPSFSISNATKTTFKRDKNDIQTRQKRHFKRDKKCP